MSQRTRERTTPTQSVRLVTTLLAPPSWPELLSPPALEHARSRSRSRNWGVLTSPNVVSIRSRPCWLDVLERLGEARHQIVGWHAHNRGRWKLGRECSIVGPLRRRLIVDVPRGTSPELSSHRALLEQVQQLFEHGVRERDVFRRWESGPGQ